MSQKNQIYYTTAQVTDMVELSDQNVRKYVRMLEERGYEVAKDEHQRRLFSQDDVHVLNEMITVSKTPGFTLELAADEIMNTLDEIISRNAVEEVDYTTTNDDVLKALEKVLHKLEDMRQENLILRKNVGSLVARLEDYDTHILEVSKEQKLLSSQVEEIKDNAEVPKYAKTNEKSLETVEMTEKEVSDPQENFVNRAEINKDQEVAVESLGKTEAELAEELSENLEPVPSTNIDMNAYIDPVEEGELPEENEEKPKSSNEMKTEESTIERETPKKKGFFARLFGG